MVWHGDGLLRATARPVMAVLGGLTLSITVGNKGNKVTFQSQLLLELSYFWDSVTFGTQLLLGISYFWVSVTFGTQLYIAGCPKCQISI